MPEMLEPGDDHLRELGYEHRDVAIPTLIKWLIGLFIFVGVSSGIALLLYILFVPYHPETVVPKPSPQASGTRYGNVPRGGGEGSSRVCVDRQGERPRSDPRRESRRKDG